METLTELVARITADATQLKAGLAGAEKSVQSFGQKFNSTISGLQAPLNRLSTSMLVIGTAITGMAVLSVKNFASMGSQLTNLAIKTGFSTTALSKLSYMAKINNTSIEGLEVGIRRMQSVLYDASKGSKEAAASLSAIGISVEDIIGLSPEQQFEAITNALADMEDQNTKVRVAQDLFSRSGTQLLPILEMGKEGMKAAGDEAQRLGVVMDTETAAGANKLDTSLKDIQVSLTGAANKIAQVLAPKVLDLAKKFTDIVVKVTEWIEKNPKLIDQIIEVGLKLAAFAVILKSVAMAMALVTAFTGPHGLAMILASIAAAGLAYVAIEGMAKAMQHTEGGVTKGYASGGIVTRPTLAMVGEAGPEAIIPLSSGGMGNTTLNFNIGTWMGDEVGIRRLSQTVLTYIREDLRRGVTSGVI